MCDKWIGKLCDMADATWSHEYAEPGYGDPGGGIAFGNWNGERNSRIAKLLERCGVECEWWDEWATCDECGRAVRTQPDSYSWTPSYVYHDGAILCHDCVDVGDLLARSRGCSETGPKGLKESSLK